MKTRRIYLDIETLEIITMGDLYVEYLQNYQTEEEREEVKFLQYVTNCQTFKGGTLERITMINGKEVI